MTKFPLILAFSSIIFLSACAQTWEGLQEDFGKISNVVSEKTANARESLSSEKKPEERATAIMQDKLCPSVVIDPQMQQIVEFNDPAKTTNDKIVSKFKITDTNTICETDGAFVSMQIDLTFEGNIGPAAVRTGNDKVFFSYPYFVEVNDLDGNELAEEVFAASATYNRGEENKKMVETIRQKLPLEDGMAPYQIYVGFSLTEDQQLYNTSNK